MVDPDDGIRNPKPISDPVELSTQDAVLLSKLLLNADSWFFAVKRCLPKGTARIRLTSPLGDATVLIGMPCQDWDVIVDGEHCGGFFDPVDIEMRSLLKRTFPDLASSEARSMWKSGAIKQLKEGKSSI
ncbi:MAG: hypothetical protein C0483_16055 [Pirellula sp.]|nr:hypothetical protein [Pirellula sp.]